MKLFSLEEIPFEPVSHDPNLRKRVLLREGVLPGIRSVSHIVLAPGSRVGEHAHPEGSEVFYCIRGKVLFRTRGKVIALGPGQFLVVEPGEAHSIDDAQEESELFYFFVLAR